MFRLKAMGKTLAGGVHGRGDWVRLTNTRDYDYCGYLDFAVRGGGGGQGGDVSDGDNWWRGEKGDAGTLEHSLDTTCRHTISVTIGEGGDRGAEEVEESTSFAAGGDGEKGGTTSMSVDGTFVQEAEGGNGGAGAYFDGRYSEYSDHDYVSYVFSGNNSYGGGDYGKGGASYQSSPHTHLSAYDGAVFAEILD